MPDPIVSTPTPIVTTPTPTPAPAAQWHDGKVDAEVLGHMQNRGWHTKPADEVAIEAIRAHREAEKFIGAPADKIIRLPVDPKDDAGWKNVWTKLGAPADPAHYDFAAVKKADGTPADPKMIEHLRGVAATLHIPKDSASALAQEIVKFNDTQAAETKAETDAKVTAERATLAKNWGTNAEANMFVAKGAARALGVTPAEVEALEKTIGYARVMEMFRNVGSKIGEDKFIVNPNPANPGVMTREQAVARKADLMKDQAWAKRYLEGGSAENREMQGLLALIVQDDDGR